MAWPTEYSRINLLGGGVPIWGPKRLCLLLPLPYSHEAAKSGQTHWMMSNTDLHHPITPAGSHRCEAGHPRRPATLSKSCQQQPCSPRAADPPGNHTDSRARVITVFGVFCGGLLRTKANAHCSLRVSHGSAPPAQEGQANRLTVPRLAEATGNLQPTFLQTGGSPPRLATSSSPRPVLEASPSRRQWHRASFLSESVLQCSNHLSHPEFCSQKGLERWKTNLHLRVEA